MSDFAKKLPNTVKPSKPLISSPTHHKNHSTVKDLAPARSTSKFVASVSSGKGSSKSSKVDSDKKGKKVFDLPGQKHEPPEERDPLRIFYESLHHQNPKSEMAQIWMMEHGLLSPESAKKVLERRKRGQLNQKLGMTAKLSKVVTTVKSEKVVSKSPKVVSLVKSEKVVSKGMVVSPDRKVFASNGDGKMVSKVKRKLELASDSDDDKPLRPKKKLNTHA